MFVEVINVQAYLSVLPSTCLLVNCVFQKKKDFLSMFNLTYHFMPNLSKLYFHSLETFFLTNFGNFLNKLTDIKTKDV